VTYAGFAKDGRWLTTAGVDGTLRRWRMMYPDLVDVACQTAGRPLTAKEKADFLPGDHGELPCTADTVAGRLKPVPQ
jgi:hypothetical protein